MLQLQNKTPFAANLSILLDKYGVDNLHVIVSASSTSGNKRILAQERAMPTEADEYFGEPGPSSIKFSSAYHLGKLATDIIMFGDACAPEIYDPLFHNKKILWDNRILM